MTRKHYEGIASALAATRPNGNTDVELKQQWNLVVRSIANAVGPFNSHFDGPRFERACGGLWILNS